MSDKVLIDGSLVISPWVCEQRLDMIFAGTPLATAETAGPTPIQPISIVPPMIPVLISAPESSFWNVISTLPS